MSFGSPYGAPPYQSEAPSFAYQSDPSYPYQGGPPPPYFQGSQSAAPYAMQPGFQGVPPPPAQYYDQSQPPPPPRQQQRRRQAPQVNVQKIQKMTINKPIQKEQQKKQMPPQKQKVCKRQQQDFTRAFQNLRIKNLPPVDNRDPIITLYNKPLLILSQSDLPDFMEKKNQLKVDRKLSDKAIVFRMDDGSFMIMFSSIRDKNGRREFMPVRIYLPQNA